ncbi:amidohydrolase [Pseudonocardiaceae bacterium YIM PH 21723]|nr:amidohydrolase [Pseudonocardiaceae bacterium YIM PH 21723]
MVGPVDDTQVAAWTEGLGLPGLIDIHVHFAPDNVMDKIWQFFDNAEQHYGMRWPIHYRTPVAERLRTLDELGVLAFAPLVYPHKPGMGAWLTEWVLDFAARTPKAVPTATLYPEPEVTGYLTKAVDAGARSVKAHVQVGAYDPTDEYLRPAWGLLAEAQVPVVIHCGHSPIPGSHTGLDVFEGVLREHPRLRAVLAHAGSPEFDRAFALIDRYPGVHLDTTMVGVPFHSVEQLPADWAARLAGIGDRVAFGTDFPNIPYEYSTQVRAIAQWAEADERLGEGFLRAVLHDTPASLLGLS